MKMSRILLVEDDETILFALRSALFREGYEILAAGSLAGAEKLAGENPDLIVLDPPRDGIHPKALDKIIDYGVDRLVYISCKPSSLARDLVVLQERGYQVEKVRCVDMFPGTVHVETVVLLSNEKKKAYHVEIEMKI